MRILRRRGSGASIRPIVLAGGLAVAATVCVLGFALARHRTAAALAERSAREVEEARALATSIRRMRVADVQVKAVMPGDVRLTEVMENARAEVGLKREQLYRIDPMSAYRLEDSDYRLTRAGVVLRDMSLYDLVRFVLAAREANVRLMDLRLSAPARDATTWQSNLTFGVLVYGPIERDPS